MTTNHDYNTPEAGTTDWHIPLNNNFERLDTDIEIRGSESTLDQYTPTQGAKFLATDTGRRFIGDGSNWEEIPYPSSGTTGSTEFDVLSTDTTVTVEPDGSGDYTSVQAALDDMPDICWGSSYNVRVGPGDYGESVVIPPFIGVGGGLHMLGGVGGTGSSKLSQFAARSVRGGVAIDGFEFTGPMNPVDDTNGGVLQFYDIPDGLYLGDLDFSGANGGDGVYTCILLYGSINANVTDISFGENNHNGFRLKQGQVNLYTRQGNTGSLSGHKYKVNGAMVLEKGTNTGSWTADSGTADIETGMVVTSDGSVLTN
jgi:hypothetical protein